MLGRARGAEEVRLRAGGQHQHVAGPRLAVLGRHGPGRGVDAGDLGEVHVDVVLVGEHVSQRMRDVACPRAARSRPGRAAAGTGGSCCGRSA